MQDQKPNQEPDTATYEMKPFPPLPSATPQLPRELVDAILHGDIVIVLASSESGDKQLDIKTLTPGSHFAPETILSHAYAKALHEAHDQLMRTVKGEPTDAERYQALRAFACMAKANPDRFETLNVMLQKLDEDMEKADGGVTTGAGHDKVADFLIHALAETAPLVVEQQPSAH